MGRGSYTAADWLNLKKSRDITDTSDIGKICNLSGADKRYGVKNAGFREALDSAESPESTPVIIGFDVTASMDFLAKELAGHALNEIILLLHKLRPITDPQICCAAIGDCKSDASPLQITQFEADIRMASQLMDLYIERGGGGNGGESYNLLWYFASRHTKTDCVKRRKKGFLFTIGDDSCHPGLSAAEIYNVFGDKEKYGISDEELIRETEKKYEIFHIFTGRRDSDKATVFRNWSKLLPGRTALLEQADTGLLAELIISLIQMATGMDSNTVLKQWDQGKSEKLAESLASIDTVCHGDNNTIIF